MKNTIKINHPNVKMVAHRGASGLECENSNAAFVAAGNRTHFGIETDVHITKDGYYALFHDDNTVRMTGEAHVMEETEWSVLRSLKLRDKNGNTREDLVLPLLKDYIAICKDYDKVAVLELKNAMAPEHIAGIIAQIEAADYLDQTIFISFCYENLVEVKKQKPNQDVQFLTGKFTDDLIDKLKAYNMNLDIQYKALTAENVKLLHENGILINCWTCDDPVDGEKLVEYGVDYITSNILE